MNRRAAVLVLVLWLMLIAGIMLLGLNRSLQIEASMAHGDLEAVRARWAARAGLETALSLLVEDFGSPDGPADLWYDSPLDLEDIELPDGSSFRVAAPSDDGSDVRFGVDDEASRLNVNEATAEELAGLPGIESDQIQAILDWRDDDEQARPGGAERAWYQGLDLPYEIRNGDFATHRELMLVRGISPAFFLGEDADGDGLLDVSENDGDLTPPPDDRDGLLSRGFAAWTTVYSYELNHTAAGEKRLNLKQADAGQLQHSFSMTPKLAEAVVKKGQESPASLLDFAGLRGNDRSAAEDQIDQIDAEWIARHWEDLTLEEDERLPGKINVNTAPREVLRAVPGFSDDLVQALISHRRGEGGALLGVGDLLVRRLLDERQFREAAPHVTVQSNVFRVISEGRSPSGVVRRIEAIVDRGGDTPSVLHWRQDER